MPKGTRGNEYQSPKYALLMFIYSGVGIQIRLTYYERGRPSGIRYSGITFFECYLLKRLMEVLSLSYCDRANKEMALRSFMIGTI